MDCIMSRAAHRAEDEADRGLEELSLATQNIRYGACTSMAHLCKMIDPAHAPALPPPASPTHAARAAVAAGHQQAASAALLQVALPHACGRYNALHGQLRSAAGMLTQGGLGGPLGFAIA